MGYRLKNRHSMPSGFNCQSFLGKGDAMRIVRSENKKNGKTSSVGYVYVEEHGWINIELFLDKIRKDLKIIEQELGNMQKK